VSSHRVQVFFFCVVVSLISSSPAARAQVAITAPFPLTASNSPPDALLSTTSTSHSSSKPLLISYPTPTVRTASIIEPPPMKSMRPLAAESVPSHRKWLLLVVASSSAAALDAYSTRRSIAAGNIETDPTMRPFAHSPAIYVATQIPPLVMDFAGYKIAHSRNFVLRRLWWIPQTGGTALSLFAGAHNLSIAGR
jgi:hypothetical protein